MTDPINTGDYVRCICDNFGKVIAFQPTVGEVFEVAAIIPTMRRDFLTLKGLPDSRLLWAADRFEKLPLRDVERAAAQAADKLRELALNLRDGGAA